MFKGAQQASKHFLQLIIFIVKDKLKKLMPHICFVTTKEQTESKAWQYATNPSDISHSQLTGLSVKDYP